MAAALQVARGAARTAPVWRRASGTSRLTRHHLVSDWRTYDVSCARSVCSTSRPGRRGTARIALSPALTSTPHFSSSPLRSFQQQRPKSTVTSPVSRTHQISILASIRHASSSAPSPQPQPQPPSNTPPQPSPQPTTLRAKLAAVTTPRHENIYTIPNILTFSRLLAAPAVGYFILTSQPLYALTLFFYAGITDLIDGYLARRFSQTTVVGTVIDPMADKTLMTICVVALGYTGAFPWWLVTIILGRDVCLAISAIWWRWISLPPPKTMVRYWDFSLPSAEVHPTEISKINTLLQLLLLGNAMVLPVLPVGMVEAGNLQGVLEGWEYLVAGTTVWSGLSYVGNKEAVKILSQEEREEKMEAMGVQVKDVREKK